MTGLREGCTLGSSVRDKPPKPCSNLVFHFFKFMTSGFICLTIKEIIERYCPNLETAVKNYAAAGKIKIDGALDEIPNIKKKNVIILNHLRFIIEVQRVDSIQENNILKNLEDYGGFCHSASGVIDAFAHDSEDYWTSPDGMHRAIMAYLCGVEYIAINEQDVHGSDLTSDEIIEREKKFFDDKNVRSVKVSTASQMRSDKLSGQMSAQQKKLDETLRDCFIHIKEYGCDKEAALFEFDSFAELDKLLTNKTGPCYIEKDKVTKTVTFMSEFLTSTWNTPKLFAAMTYVLSNVITDDTSKAIFRKWIESRGKYSFNSYDSNWWTDRVQHSRGMESAVIRLITSFNQWHNFVFEENAIGIDKIEDVLKVMNVETRHFVEDCLVHGTSIKKNTVIVAEEEEEMAMI